MVRKDHAIAIQEATESVDALIVAIKKTLNAYPLPNDLQLIVLSHLDDQWALLKHNLKEYVQHTRQEEQINAELKAFGTLVSSTTRDYVNLSTFRHNVLNLLNVITSRVALIEAAKKDSPTK